MLGRAGLSSSSCPLGPACRLLERFLTPSWSVSWDLTLAPKTAEIRLFGGGGHALSTSFPDPISDDCYVLSESAHHTLGPLVAF